RSPSLLRRRPRRSRWRAPPAPWPSAPASERPAAASCSRPAASRLSSRSRGGRRLRLRLLDLAGVERVLDEGDDLLLGHGRLLCFRLALGGLPDREHEREPAAGHLVKHVGEQRRVLGLLGEVAVERSGRRKLEHEAVALELGGRRLAEDRGGRDRAFGHSWKNRLLPGLTELVELEPRSGLNILGQRLSRLVGPRLGRVGGLAARPGLQLLDAEGERLAREIGTR